MEFLYSITFECFENREHFGFGFFVGGFRRVFFVDFDSEFNFLAGVGFQEIKNPNFTC